MQNNELVLPLKAIRVSLYVGNIRWIIVTYLKFCFATSMPSKKNDIFMISESNHNSFDNVMQIHSTTSTHNS